MTDLVHGDKVKFKKASMPAEFFVIDVHGNGTVDLQGPHRMRRGIDPERLELIKKAPRQPTVQAPKDR